MFLELFAASLRDCYPVEFIGVGLQSDITLFELEQGKVDVWGYWQSRVLLQYAERSFV